jgi:catechol 2,3-dioxygenase-like lactoylglutathione lyase family enzyme
MKVLYTSIMVDDQAKALQFYTEVLGFEKKMDLPIEDARWLTVVSREAPDAVELVLEPMGVPASRVYQKALYDAGIPLTVFGVEDMQQEYNRMKALGVVFKLAPLEIDGGMIVAMFEDTCGNLIQLIQA